MVLSFEQTWYIICVYIWVIITRFDLDVNRQFSQSLSLCQILHSYKKIGAVYISLYRIVVDDMGVNSCFDIRLNYYCLKSVRFMLA